MTRRIQLFGLLISSLVADPAFAQFNDTFADNDFTANPTWAGDDVKFGIDNFQLRLQAPVVASSAFLSTSSQSINNATWEFKVKMDFNPSNSNYTRVYLVSNQSNLVGSLNGYYIMIGDTPDEVSLYRQSGSSSTKIIDGADGLVNLSVVNIAVKVTRDDQGNWELFSDVGITGSFTPGGAILDNTFTASNYFGIYCNYTSTRSDKFYFDDFQVTGDSYIDNLPPVINNIEVINSKKLLVHFNEFLESSTAELISNYQVSNNSLASAILQSDQKSVELTFGNPFTNGLSQVLHVAEVKDTSGNSILPNNYNFLFFVPVLVHPKDIVITEILADPSPQIGLPDIEFIEIYNRSENPFNTADWVFTDGNSKAVLLDKIILPGEYWVITSTANVSKFGMTTKVMGVSNFPTLNNASDTLIIKSIGGVTVDSLNYNLSWYRNIDKQEGGWSLEIIDPDNICGDEENWVASENESGGTPGTVNSVFANKPDLKGPQLVSLEVITENQLRISFNEKLETPISSTVSFSISPDVGISHYYFDSKSLRSIMLVLDPPLATRQLYTLIIHHLFDCSSNEINADFNQINFALPEEAEQGDILINEILFNPRPNGVDFVELYNKSDKYINLKNWKIGNFNNDLVENAKTITSASFIIAPGQYLALTMDPLVLKNNYPMGIEENFLTVSLPSFSDDEGSVALTSPSQYLIDHFIYDSKFHSSFVKNDEGVSLERISFFQDSNGKANWASCSSVAGFATPGFQNSNHRPESVTTNGEITIDPRVFVPNSGADFSKINFRFDQPGFVANVKILDHQGRLIKTIANNAILGYEGFFRWDGDLEDGSKARHGYYVVWFEVYNSAGNLKTYRERVIIALR